MENNRKFTQKLISIKNLTNGQKVYLSSLSLAILAFIFYILTFVKLPIQLMYLLLFSSILTLMIGLIVDVLSICRFIWSTTFGKYILSGLILIIGNMTIGISYQIVQNITHSPPELFKLTISSLAVLMIPLNSAWIVTAIYLSILIVVVAISPLLLIKWLFNNELKLRLLSVSYMYLKRLKHISFKKITWSCRIIATFIVASFSMAMIRNVGIYEYHILNKFAKWHTHTFEMYEC